MLAMGMLKIRVNGFQQYRRLHGLFEKILDGDHGRLAEVHAYRSGQRSEHDDGELISASSEPVCKVETVIGFLHHYIEDDQVGVLLMDEIDRKQHLICFDDIGIVVD
jgi:hypothetical protein